MIVRNEAANIQRCLRSVAPYIDYWVILDTGSTDDTPEQVEHFFERRGIPGQLHRSSFVDFSTARNQALDLCRQSAGVFDYILLIDADMELVVEEAPWPPALEQPVYTVRQSGGLVYDNVRLVRRDLRASYRGVTHEYLDTEHASTRLQGVHMIDHASGGNRAGKTERDIELLLKGLRDEPDNVRYMFYLAQSLRDAGRFEEACRWYEKRAAAGHWEEEQWYARYQQASCLFELGRYPEAVSTALAAWELRPHRAEPLALLARKLRERGDHNLCCEFAAIGMRRPFPEHDRLFIEPDVYPWRFLEELSIAGYYAEDTQYRQLGGQCCHRLSTSADAPEAMRGLARSNLRHYAHQAEQWLGFAVQAEFNAPGAPEFAALNPSICMAGAERGMVLRCANYHLQDQRYVIHDPDGVIRTENFLVPLDETLQPQAMMPIFPATGDDAPDLAQRHPFPVRGYEDCRLVRWRDSWWISATVRDTTPEGICEIALLQLDGEGRIIREDLLRGPWSAQHQKNWMPFVHDDALHFLYSIDPAVILRYDGASGTVEKIAESMAEADLGHLRGGSQLIPLEGGWLGLCHEASVDASGQRAYLHRFLQLDGSFQLVGLSDTFTLTGGGIEFCAGLALDSGAGQLLLSFGVNDGSALLGAVSLEKVRERLHAPL